MTRRFCRLVGWCGLLGCLLLLITTNPSGQSGSGNGEWRTYGSDLRQTRYSALDQINTSNFS